VPNVATSIVARRERFVKSTVSMNARDSPIPNTFLTKVPLLGEPITPKGKDRVRNLRNIFPPAAENSFSASGGKISQPHLSPCIAITCGGGFIFRKSLGALPRKATPRASRCQARV
jgi:hypothetical protein